MHPWEARGQCRGGRQLMGQWPEGTLNTGTSEITGGDRVQGCYRALQPFPHWETCRNKLINHSRALGAGSSICAGTDTGILFGSEATDGRRRGRRSMCC